MHVSTTAETERYLANCFVLVFVRPAIWKATHCVRGQDCQISEPQLVPPPEAVPACHKGLVFKQLLSKGLIHVAVQ